MNLGGGNLGKSQSKVLRLYNDGKPTTIREIEQYFLTLPMEQIPNEVKNYQLDSRVGVQNICKQYKEKHKKYVKEYRRMERLKEFDKVFTNNGEYILAGIDEAGRGPLAGPVVAAAVVLPKNIEILGINDSKQVNESNRERLYDEIMEKAILVGVGIVGPDVIDEINILQATFRAMTEALTKLKTLPQVLLIDGNQTIPQITDDYIQHAVVRGDTKSMSIAAASIIAKVTRDEIMRNYDRKYPDYGFFSNKGYGSNHHQRALQEFGPTPIHRMSFIKNILNM